MKNTWNASSSPVGRPLKPSASAGAEIEAAVRAILVALGEDPEREGLRETPMRVSKMYLEIFGGLFDDPSRHFETQFLLDTDTGIVVIKDIQFYSMCEHHLLPFFGKAHVAYLPGDERVAGLSKFARVVETLSRRPQMQERMTAMIAETMTRMLNPKGVLVLLEAEHMCMAMRGIRSDRASTKTLVATGVFKANALQRAEALSMIYGKVANDSTAGLC